MADVAVVGPGAVGLALADSLKRAQISVELVAREDRVAELRQRGLWIKHPGRSVAAIDVPVVVRPSPETKVILLATKTYALPQAIAQSCQGRGAETAVVCLQNGLNADALLREHAPTVSRFGGVVSFSANSMKPGEVEVRENGRLAIGLGGADGGEAQAALPYQLLAPSLELKWIKDLEGARWTKLIVNLNNGLFAATGLSARPFYGHRYGPFLAVQTMREGLRVAKAAGARLRAIPSTSPLSLKLLGLLPLTLAVALFERRTRAILSDEFEIYGSTLQSLRKHQPTEIDELNGAVSRLAPSLGVATPLNDAIVKAVKAQGRGESAMKIEKLVAIATGD